MPVGASVGDGVGTMVGLEVGECVSWISQVGPSYISGHTQVNSSSPTLSSPLPLPLSPPSTQAPPFLQGLLKQMEVGCGVGSDVDGDIDGAWDGSDVEGPIVGIIEGDEDDGISDGMAEGTPVGDDDVGS